MSDQAAAQTSEFLDRDAILRADDLVTRDVDVPEWGGRVRLKALSSEERDDFEAGLWVDAPDPKDPRKTIQKLSRKNGRARLVSLCLIYASGPKAGERMFPDESDVVKLGKKNGRALHRCFEVCSELSGLSEEAKKELGKDSGGTPSDSPSSASPAN